MKIHATQDIARELLSRLEESQTRLLEAYTIRVKLTGITVGTLTDLVKRNSETIAKARRIIDGEEEA